MSGLARPRKSRSETNPGSVICVAERRRPASATLRRGNLVPLPPFFVLAIRRCFCVGRDSPTLTRFDVGSDALGRLGSVIGPGDRLL